MIRRALCVLAHCARAAFITTLTQHVVYATESGQVHYPLGVNTIMTAALPAPGDTQAYQYIQYYESNRLNDKNGHAIDANFHASVYAFVPRIIHTWNATVGPFNLASGLVIPFTKVQVQAFGRRDSSTGLGDIVLAPIYFTYMNPTGTFFAYGGPELSVPTGEYDKNSLANNGLNYYSFSPTINFTWLFAPRWEASIAFYSEFNTKNKDTDYRSGTSVMSDFNLAYRPFVDSQRWKFAIQGYALKQLTDDRQYGEAVNDGNRGQVFAVGPQVSYDIANGLGGIVVKYQKEFGAENRSQGNRFWFEFTAPF